MRHFAARLFLSILAIAGPWGPAQAATFLVGAQLYSSSATGANSGGVYQYSTNSSTSNFGLTINGTTYTPGGSGISIPLLDGLNSFSYTVPTPVDPGAFVGLNLFFNTTGVPYNPVNFGQGLPGDLTVFTSVGAPAGSFSVPVQGTNIQSYETSFIFTNPASYSGNSSYVLGDRQISVTGFTADSTPSGSFQLSVSPVATPIEQTYQLTGTLGSSVNGNFTAWDWSDINGTFKFFSNAQNVSPTSGEGLFRLNDFTLAISNTSQPTQLLFNNTSQGFIELGSWSLLVTPSPINPLDDPLAGLTSFAAGRVGAFAAKPSYSCGGPGVAPDRISYSLLFDDVVPNTGVAPTAPPTGNLVSAAFELWKEQPNGTLCKYDEIPITNAKITAVTPPPPESVPEPGVLAGLVGLGAWTWRRKRRQEAAIAENA